MVKLTAVLFPGSPPGPPEAPEAKTPPKRTEPGFCVLRAWLEGIQAPGPKLPICTVLVFVCELFAATGSARQLPVVTVAVLTAVVG